MDRKTGALMLGRDTVVVVLELGTPLPVRHRKERRSAGGTWQKDPGDGFAGLEMTVKNAQLRSIVVVRVGESLRCVEKSKISLRERRRQSLLLFFSVFFFRCCYAGLYLGGVRSEDVLYNSWKALYNRTSVSIERAVSVVNRDLSPALTRSRRLTV